VGQARARLTVAPVTVCPTGSSGARRPAPAGGDRRPPGGLRVAAMGRLPSLQRGQPDSSISTDDKPAHKGNPSPWHRTRKAGQMAGTDPSYRSPIGVAPCGPVGGRPIRAMTIIRVVLKRLGPGQSAAWALDRSGTGPRPTRLGSRGNWTVAQSAATPVRSASPPWPPGSSGVRPAKWPSAIAGKGCILDRCAPATHERSYERTPRLVAFPQVNAGVVGLAGLEPAASSLSAIVGSPLCNPAFLQVAADRQG
jgi:hypothetical protein